jgi:hypothetical protein
MIVPRVDKQWSIDFVTSVVSLPNGLREIEDLLSNHSTVYPLPECPFCIFTYQDMNDCNPCQDICKENEVVLSKDFVGYEEEIQVLTYDQLKEIVFTVLQNKDS